MVLHRPRLATRIVATALVIFSGQVTRGQTPVPPTPPSTPPAPASMAPPAVSQKITAINTTIEMTVNGSRILTMDSDIPRAQVGNPELIAFTVISENEVQLYAKKAGITTVNLWDKDDQVHSVDVLIVGDVRELEGLLKAQFPTASLKLYPTQSSTLVLSGYVDRSDHVNTIMRIAEDYFPKVINNMIVGGTQQVQLHVKVMEVARTNLKELGFDFANFTSGNFVTSSAAGVITGNPTAGLFRTAASFGSSATTPPTVQFGIVNNPNGFVGFLEALKRENLVKILAEPNLVTVSGRPASYQVGGEIPYPQPTGFGNISINFKPFGTMIDFVPIVLGNGSVRLEVRPQVLELDQSLGILINGTAVPGFTNRAVDTGVEMKFGQTLAIAGLLQQKTVSEKRGVPYLMDLPYVGAAFRRTSQQINEVELLIMVRPELVEAMDPDQVPNCAPGLNSQSPGDGGLYWKGYIETPVQPYGPDGHGPGAPTGMMPPRGPVGPGPEGMGPPPGPEGAMEDGPVIYGPGPEQVPTPAGDRGPMTRGPAVPRGAVVISDRAVETPGTNRVPETAQPPRGTSRNGSYNQSNPQGRSATRPMNPNPGNSTPPGFIGPIGYDVKK